MRIVAALAFLTIASGQPASFSVDGAATSASITVATVEPRTAAPGYSWLRVYFWSSPLTSDDLSNAAKGRVASIHAKWAAALQLTLDKDATVWQIDLSLPGHTCTIAESDRDAKSALQEFRFDGKYLRLRGKGSHRCEMKFAGVPDQTFTWDVDLESPVVERAR